MRILTIKAVNDSARDILKGHYDPEDPVGLKVTSGKVIRSELVEASNDYLKRNVTFESPTDNIIHFKDVILDAHEFFVLKLLVLHPASEDVSIESVGHISGIQSIIIREPFKDVGRPAFLVRTFTGSWAVQIIRIIAYTLLTILIILLIVIPTSLISDKAQEIRRRHHVSDFKAATQLDLIENDEFIFGRYVSGGVDEMLNLQALSRSKKTLIRAYYRHKWMRKKFADRKQIFKEVHVMYPQHFYPGSVWFFAPYIEAGFVRVENGKPAVDEHMAQTLEHFIRFLRNRQIIHIEEDATRKGRKLKSPGVHEISNEVELDAEQKDSYDSA